MGFNPPVPEQYSDWEIRAAVLFSLMLQVLLIFVAPVRKRSSSLAPQFIVWSCYLLADWVADLALGLLLNNLGNISGGSSSATAGCGSSSPIIFAFWAPFLLLHLGGPDSISAYSLADNELWLRHLFGLLFELTAAAVVFFCSITQGSYNPMIPATVLMFVVGIIKYGERTYSLYFARVEPDPGPEYANRKIDIFGGHQGTRRRHGGAEDLENLSVEAQGYEFFRVFRFLYVNLILSFVSERRMSHDFFMARSDSSESFAVVEAELNFLYDVKYTKAPVIHTRTGYVLRSVCSCCLVASLALFVHADKGGSILPVDVGITYALLGGAVALDVAALAILLLSDWTTVFLERSRRLKWLAGFIKRIKRWRRRQPRRRWSETTSQMNIISRSLGRPDSGGRFLWHAAELLGLGATFEDFFFVRQAPLSTAEGEQRHIFEFIFGRLKEVASTAQNYEEIKKACQLRGMGAIDQKLGEQGSMTIRDSVTKDLDESLLLWHVATDLCLAGAVGGDEKFAEMREISKCLSDYMLYLLIKQSDMLSAVAGIGLIRYRDTCAEARKLFSSLGLMKRSSADRLHDDMARSTLLIQAAAATMDRVAKAKAEQQEEENSDASRSVLLDACALATELKKLEEKTMWEVVMGVWGEMLTFVACRGRGISHVQQLSRGGELITLVSFLMNHLGLGMMY
jgi:hypothetical protein